METSWEIYEKLCKTAPFNFNRDEKNVDRPNTILLLAMVLYFDP